MSKTNKKDSTAIKDSKHDAMFKIIKNKQGKFMIAVGNQIISRKEFDSFSRADEYIGTKPWEILINLNYLICKEYEKEKNNSLEISANTEKNK